MNKTYWGVLTIVYVILGSLMAYFPMDGSLDSFFIGFNTFGLILCVTQFIVSVLGGKN